MAKQHCIICGNPHPSLYGESVCTPCSETRPAIKLVTKVCSYDPRSRSVFAVGCTNEFGEQACLLPAVTPAMASKAVSSGFWRIMDGTWL